MRKFPPPGGQVSNLVTILKHTILPYLRKRHGLVMRFNMVEAVGFEPTTPGLKDRYSDQLSYASILGPPPRYWPVFYWLRANCITLMLAVVTIQLLYSIMYLLSTTISGGSGEIRTPNMQFWRLPFCQLELLTRCTYLSMVLDISIELITFGGNGRALPD